MDGSAYNFYHHTSKIIRNLHHTPHAFITETPLNLIQSQKMTKEHNNPLISYRKNLKNTVQFSKRFHTNQTVTTEFSVNDENDKQIEEENHENSIKQQTEMKNSDVLTHLNFFFQSKKTKNLNINEKRPFTEFKRLRLKNKRPESINNIEDLIIDNNKQQIIVSKLSIKSPNNLNFQKQQSTNSIKSISLDESNENIENITASDKEMKQLSLKFKLAEPTHEQEKPVGRSPINTTSPLLNSPLLNSPFNKEFFSFQEFKDLSKLELRKKLFRKYSITKREKRPIFQNILEQRIQQKDLDYQQYINKRKEFEVFYEDDLYKAGYFDEGNQEDHVIRKKELESGLIQRDLTGAKKTDVIKMKVHFKQEIENGTHRLYDKYLKNEKEEEEQRQGVLETIREIKDDSFLRVRDNILTTKEIERVKKEFQSILPNYDILDDCMKSLKFFSRFDKKTRMDLIRKSNFQEFAQNQIIFNQGDFGNYMYVILKGAINIRRIRTTKDHIIQNIVVNTLYDGDIFGELAMMGTTQKKEKNIMEINKNNGGNEEIDEQLADKEYIERTKRMATTQAAENTYVLAISRTYFKKILLSSTQKELDDKLNFLMGIPGFSMFEPHSLIPLANNLEICYFGTGEIVLKEGEKPSCLYIIKQGSCKLVKCLFVKRELCPSIYTKGLRKALPNLNFGSKQDMADKDKKNENNYQKKKIINHNKSIDRIRNSKILFGDPKILENEDKIHYNDMIEYGTLMEGDFIGQRALYNIEKLKSNEVTTPHTNEIEDAKVSVVADSHLVELLKLEKKSLEFIPEFLKVALIKEIQNTVEFDENLNIEKDFEYNKQWNKYKQNYTKEIIKADALYKQAKDFYKMY